jgi:ABC-type nitrate/sulfonate/bicarbonate transport system ATPase subunit
VSVADVRLDRVTKRFGDFAAVDDLSLSIEPGEFFSMLGPSGCGKTTTLRMIGGFEEVTAGPIYLGEPDVTDCRRSSATSTPSSRTTPSSPTSRLRERRLRPAPPKVAKEIRGGWPRCSSWSSSSGYERSQARQLSAGSSSASRWRARSSTTRVLLLDEPLGALDLKLRKQMQIELKRIQTEVGITFIYVTHDQEEAMTMSDRIAVMRAGRIEQLGRPRSCTSGRGRSSWPASWASATCSTARSPADRRVPRRPARRRHHGARARDRRTRSAARCASACGPRSCGHARGGRRGDDGTGRKRARGDDPRRQLHRRQHAVPGATGDGHRLTVYAQNLETSGAPRHWPTASGPPHLEAAAHVRHRPAEHQRSRARGGGRRRSRHES